MCAFCTRKQIHIHHGCRTQKEEKNIIKNKTKQEAEECDRDENIELNKGARMRLRARARPIIMTINEKQRNNMDS